MEGNQPSAAETPVSPSQTSPAVSPSLASEPGKASIARSETEPSVTTVITSSAPAETKPSDLTSDEKKPSAREGSLSPTNPTPIADSKDINTGPILPPPSSSSPPPTPTVPTNQHKRPSTSEPTPSSQTQAQQQSQPLPSPQTSKRRKTKAKSQEAKESSPTMASDRPRLSEQEKKNNHIASEQKRRMAIREGFDRLTEIVPGLEGQGRSESIVLKKSVDHMRDVLNERQELIRRIKALGGEIPPDLQ